MDRQYTFTFFTGQKMVPSDRAAFLDWFPRLAEVGGQCRDQIQAAIDRGGFMATGRQRLSTMPSWASCSAGADLPEGAGDLTCDNLVRT